MTKFSAMAPCASLTATGAALLTNPDVRKGYLGG